MTFLFHNLLLLNMLMLGTVANVRFGKRNTAEELIAVEMRALRYASGDSYGQIADQWVKRALRPERNVVTKVEKVEVDPKDVSGS